MKPGIMANALSGAVSGALAAGLLCGILPGAALAEVLSDTSPTIRRDLCVGTGCLDIESFSSRAQIKLKSNNVQLIFEDNSTTAGFPANDWAILANDTFTGGQEYFAVQDSTANTAPFRIMAGAPENALYLATDGDLGLGTMLPVRDLHLTGVVEAGIRFEDMGGSPYSWDLIGYSSGFYLYDPQTNYVPFSVRPGAPHSALNIDYDGFIGLGTADPEGKLHVKSNGVQLNYFESGDGGPVQVRFRSDSENRRFLAVNNANEVKSQIIFKDNEILFTGQTDSGANRWLTIGPSGILSQGPTCSGAPCDRTFDTSYFTVPPIAERAAYMWENMHLPAVGPTTPGEQINLTEKMGGVIHELEVAHIYIEQLNERLEAQRAQLKAERAKRADLSKAQEALNVELLARIERLEKRD